MKHFASVAVWAAVAMSACTNGTSSHEPATRAAPVPAAMPESPAIEPAPSAEPLPAGELERAKSSHPPRDERPTRVAASSDAAGPPLEQMALARPVGKIGVPVDVRYQVSGVVAKDQPATVQLAFVPRVAGSNLQVEFPDTAGVTIDAGARPLRSEKATTSDVLRHSVLVTPTHADTGEMRAIVSMEFDGGRYFSIFSIPVGAQPEATMKRPPKE